MACCGEETDAQKLNPFYLGNDSPTVVDRVLENRFQPLFAFLLQSLTKERM